MGTGRTRLGIFAFHPIQYQTPLWQRLAARNVIDVDVLFLDDTGLTRTMDPGFGVEVSWDIDLVAGYRHAFLRRVAGTRPSWLSRLRTLDRWLRRQDAVVLHGYGDPWMLAGALLCRARRKPYLLRGDSKPESQSTMLVRRWLRNRVAAFVVRRSAGALTIGKLNSDFYAMFGQPRHFWAPYSVDNDRFARAEPEARATVLARHDLPTDRPVILYVGKFQRIKRPLDVVRAARRLSTPVCVLFVGEGELRADIEAELQHDLGRVVGFINQGELPAYYQAADVLVLASEIEQWGLVVNEAMAAGTLPVVSSDVGAGPDLVQGVGHVYPTGDVAALTTAFERALSDLRAPDIRQRVRDRAASYSIDVTAEGFEQGAIAAASAS